MQKQYIFILLLATILCASCEDWLTVEPQDMVTVDKALENPDGYTAALIGVYQTMQNAYNPSAFMIGSGVDILSNAYAEPSYSFSSTLNSCYNYDFDDTQLDAASGVAFLQLYQAIANVNVIIENIETEEALEEADRQMIEGEAKALRAFLHFDLWRVYGTAPDDPTGNSDAVLPYALEISNSFLPYSNYSDYFTYLLADLEEAKALLAESDPIMSYSNDNLNVEGSIDEYVELRWYNRQNRFNYFATVGLLARVELWMGNTAQAYLYAKEVVDAINDDGSNKFRLGTSSDLGNGDYPLFVEQLFGLEVLDYDDESYSTYSAFCVNSQYVLESIYPSVSDIRRMNLITTLTSNALVYQAQISRKYSSMSEDDVSAYKSIPIMRLSEMYMILVETAPSLSEAQEYYDTFSNTRFDQAVTLTEANRQDVLINQYIREFWAEGQIFYLYKRLGLSSLPISSQEMSIDKYRIQVPTGETTVNL